MANISEEQMTEQLNPVEAEHDRIFPPWDEKEESAKDFILRALSEHSNSHMTWVTHYEKNPEKQGKDSEGHSLAYQERCVFRYNQIFRAFKELTDKPAQSDAPSADPDLFTASDRKAEHIEVKFSDGSSMTADGQQAYEVWTFLMSAEQFYCMRFGGYKGLPMTKHEAAEARHGG